MKSKNLNFLEPSGPLQAYNGTAIPFFFVENGCADKGVSGWCLWFEKLEIEGEFKKFICELII